MGRGGEWIPTPTSPHGSGNPTPPMGVGIPLPTPKLSGTPGFPLPLPPFFKVSKHWSGRNPHSTLPLQQVNTT